MPFGYIKDPKHLIYNLCCQRCRHYRDTKKRQKVFNFGDTLYSYGHILTKQQVQSKPTINPKDPSPGEIFKGAAVPVIEQQSTHVYYQTHQPESKKLSIMKLSSFPLKNLQS